ncbi:hypothetical protein AB4144_46365 [Rhizobiaceae sp. 2RAB30]
MDDDIAFDAKTGLPVGGPSNVIAFPGAFNKPRPVPLDYAEAVTIRPATPRLNIDAVVDAAAAAETAVLAARFAADDDDI